MNSIRGWDALASTVDKTDLEKPSSIKGTLLRQYIATVSQILNMNENEMDWLATHLGHDIRVHRNFYRLRHEHIELAKVAKLLYTVDSGDLHKYVGKKLDDLDINDMTLAEDVDHGNDDAGVDDDNDDDAPNYV
ncbi:hypothetical protein SNE40_021096 [Patella caerulea]|uniref:Uncharacterized protein n=1 Tax=Patella caerulea TaxID=87958 RepID=A0AAN8IYQ3_PATCE